jgi:hypothetical protein
VCDIAANELIAIQQRDFRTTLHKDYNFTTISSTGWTVRGSNPVWGEIFLTRPDRPWGPPILLYNGYRVSFPGVKRPGRGVDHSPLSSVRVKERVELYLYSASGPSRPVLGRTLPLPIFYLKCSVNTDTQTDTVTGRRWEWGHKIYFKKWLNVAGAFILNFRKAARNVHGKWL